MNDLQHLLRGVIVALLLLAPGLLWAAEPAGYVLMATGKVVAVQTNHDIRALERKSPFYSGESLKTGPKAKAQVRFRDGSLISMRPDTEIRIDEFRYHEEDKGEDKNIFTLINGGFRTITGKIGKKNPKNYQMKSSVASIGVRGTNYEVVVVKDGIDVAVWHGTIVVENQGGAITLGAEGNFSFAHVSEPTIAPTGSLKPPAGISTPLPDSTQADVTAVADMTSGQVTQQPVLPPIQDPALAVGDLRLQGVTLDRAGLMMRSNNLAGSYFSTGQASSSGPVLADNGLLPGDAGYATAAINNVIMQGGATLVSSYADPTYPISWGIWDAARGSEVLVLTDPNDLSVSTRLAEPVVWMSVQPTADSVLASLTGGGYYHSAPVSPATQGVSNAGLGISSLDADLFLNFDTALFKGTLSLVTNPSDTWNLSFNGKLLGPRLSVTNMSGSYSGAGGSGTANGKLFMILAGSNPDAIAGGFDLEYAADPNFFVQGNFIAERDLRLSFAEAADMQRVALGTIGGAGSTSTFIGRSTSGTSPVIALNGYSDPAQSAFWLQQATDVIRQNGAPNLAAAQSTTAYQVGTPDATYTVSWGAWNGQSSPLSKQTDPIDPTVTTALNSNLFWISALPSPIDSITGTPGGKTGIVTYNQTASNWIVGNTNTAAIDGATFSFTANLDFNTGNITSGNMGFSDLASNYWNASFTGTLNGSQLQITAPAVYYNTNPTPAAAQMQAILTGPKAEGIAGSFDFDLSSGTATAEGVFLVSCSGNTGC
jgi:hypothetical protein